MSQLTEWNHNTHCHRYLLNQLPESVDKALDIGCGLGLFSQRLATRAKLVDALDVDDLAKEIIRVVWLSQLFIEIEPDFLQVFGLLK